LKDAVKAKDVNKINELETSINSVWNEVSQRVYANNQTQQQPTDNTVNTGTVDADNQVQDADFEEVS
jgi:hypothetical protein